MLGHPVYGSSWEGFMIENIVTKYTEWDFYYYRTSSGNEIDLVLTYQHKIIAIECKASTDPKISRGFWTAIEDINPSETYIITPVKDRYVIKNNVIVTHLQDFLKLPL